LQLLNEIFRHVAASDLTSALSPGATHPRAPADPNLRPWTPATIKNTLNQPLFFAASPLGSIDKTDVNFRGTCAAHPR